MKGIEQIMIALIVLALALSIFGTGGLMKKTIFDDCSFIESAPAKIAYSKTIQVDIGNYAGSSTPDSVFSYALLISNIPSYATVQSATATRTYLGPDSYGIGRTAVNSISYGGDIPGGRCGDKIIFSYPRQGLQGSFRLAPDTGQYVGGWDGTYNLKYNIVFAEGTISPPIPSPVVTPMPSPVVTPMPTPVTSIQPLPGRRIPIISDLADLLRQLLSPVLLVFGIRV